MVEPKENLKSYRLGSSKFTVQIPTEYEVWDAISHGDDKIVFLYDNGVIQVVNINTRQIIGETIIEL